MASSIQRALEAGRTARQGSLLARDLPRLLPWGRWSPAKLLEVRARKGPDDLALAFEDRRYTWRQVDENANRYANFFAREGVGAGDVVALMMDNRPEFLFIVCGLNKLGAVGALINTNLTGRPLRHAITVSKAGQVLCGGEHLDAVADALEAKDLAEGEDPPPAIPIWVQLENGDDRDPGRARPINGLVRISSAGRPRTGHRARNADTYCYIYTSGTTGLPKAAIIRNQRMLGANVLFGHLMHQAGPGDVIYVPLPLYHSSAMFLGWGAALATGAGMGLRRRSRPRASGRTSGPSTPPRSSTSASSAGTS